MSNRTQFLTPWEILAITQAVEKFDKLEARSKKALLEKLEKASHVRLSFYGSHGLGHLKLEEPKA